MTSFVLALAVLAGCAGSDAGGNSQPGEVSEAWKNPPRVGTGRDPDPVSLAGDRRVILHQPPHARQPNPITMIMVNEAHSERASTEGRIRLAMNDPAQAYKVLGEQEMQALFESMEDRGLDSVSTPYTAQDAQYFDDSLGIERFRGILFIENGGKVTKVLGFKPTGKDDFAGQQRYRVFAEMKVLVFRWYNSRAESELPVSGISLPSAPGRQ
jgi:hypothetical protein